jgi:hypothetical protein
MRIQDSVSECGKDGKNINFYKLGMGWQAG